MKEVTDPWIQSEQDQVEQIWERTITMERKVLWVLPGPCLLVGFSRPTFPLLQNTDSHRQLQGSHLLSFASWGKWASIFNLFKISWRKSVIGLHVPSPKRKATFNRMDHKLYLNTIQVFRLHVAERSVLVAQLCPTLWTPWTIVHHGPLSMEFSRQEHWSGLPCPSPGDLPDPGIEHWSPALQVDASLAERRECI